MLQSHRLQALSSFELDLDNAKVMDSAWFSDVDTRAILTATSSKCIVCFRHFYVAFFILRKFVFIILFVKRNRIVITQGQ